VINIQGVYLVSVIFFLHLHTRGNVNGVFGDMLVGRKSNKTCIFYCVIGSAGVALVVEVSREMNLVENLNYFS